MVRIFRINRFRLLEPAKLKISIDLAKAGEGFQTVVLDGKDVNMPTNLSLYGIEHKLIHLDLRKRPETTKSIEPSKGTVSGAGPPQP